MAEPPGRTLGERMRDEIVAAASELVTWSSSTLLWYWIGWLLAPLLIWPGFMWFFVISDASPPKSGAIAFTSIGAAFVMMFGANAILTCVWYLRYHHLARYALKHYPRKWNELNDPPKHRFFTNRTERVHRLLLEEHDFDDPIVTHLRREWLKAHISSVVTIFATMPYYLFVAVLIFLLL